MADLENELARRGDGETLTRVVIDRLRYGKLWQSLMDKIKPSEHAFLNKILKR